MPVELSLPILLSSEDFQKRMTSKCKRPLRPCFHAPLQQPELDDVPQEQGKVKKQVSFADHKGLALAVVKIFSEFDDPVEVPLSIRTLFTSDFAVSEEVNRLVLDFAQPCADYLRFRRRLEQDFISLEHCVLKDRAVAGMIKVKNLSFEKAVKVRITFDSWKSQTDVDCLYVKDTYSGSDMDTFSFELDLPERVALHDRIEFAVFYEVNGKTYWDSNSGQNYRIVHSALKKNSNDSNNQHYTDRDVYFDRYGSPRCSQGIFPDWPSYAGYEDLGPYY